MKTFTLSSAFLKYFADNRFTNFALFLFFTGSISCFLQVALYSFTLTLDKIFLYFSFWCSLSLKLASHIHTQQRFMYQAFTCCIPCKSFLFPIELCEANLHLILHEIWNRFFFQTAYNCLSQLSLVQVLHETFLKQGSWFRC